MEPGDFVTMVMRLASLRGDTAMTLPQQVTHILETSVGNADYVDVGSFLAEMGSRDVVSVLDIHDMDTHKVYACYSSSEEATMTHDDFEKVTEESGLLQQCPNVSRELVRYIARMIQGGEFLSRRDFHAALGVLASYYMPCPWVPLKVKLRVFLNVFYLQAFKRKLGMLTIQD